MNHIENTGLNLEFPTTEVLAKLKENRSKHAEEYLEAKRGYRAALKQSYETAIAEFTKTVVNLNEEYDTAIGMLDMTTADKVTLTQTQFHSYVRDRWEWEYRFLQNARYSGSIAARAATL